jgi:hypothetical protein
MDCAGRQHDFAGHDRLEALVHQQGDAAFSTRLRAYRRRRAFQTGSLLKASRIR